MGSLTTPILTDSSLQIHPTHRQLNELLERKEQTLEKNTRGESLHTQKVACGWKSLSAELKESKKRQPR
jgi:hypothetical protein